MSSNGMETLEWDLPLLLRSLASGASNPDGIRDGSDRDAIITAARDRLENDTLTEEQRLLLVANGFPELDE